MKLLIELIDNKIIDVEVKGDKHTLVATAVQAMEEMPELAEAIMTIATTYIAKNRFKPLILKP